MANANFYYAPDDKVSDVQLDNSGDLFKMLYVSRMEYQALVNPQAFSNIVELAKKNHERFSIHCVLCFYHGYFIEYAEGSEQTLTEIKNNLLKSMQFENLKILDFSRIEGELRLNKNMKVIHFKETIPQFNHPYAWTKDTQEAFINQLSQYPDDNREMFSFLQLYLMRSRLLSDISMMRLKSLPKLLLLTASTLVVLMLLMVGLLLLRMS